MFPASLFFGSFILVLGFSFPVYRLLKSMGVVDRPNQRSSHHKPTVKGGGIAILSVVILIGGWIIFWYQSSVLAVLLLSALMLAVISMLDDIRGLPVIARFIFHFIAACAAIIVLVVLDWGLPMSPDDVKVIPSIIIVVLGILWISGYTNAFNFMDGINGLAVGQAALTGFTMALLGGVATGQWDHPAVLFSLVLAGASTGFLPYNFPKARMFMGDVGSAPLGFSLAALVLWMVRDFGLWILVPLVLLQANILLDTAITLIRRICRGAKFYEAHREHFYQRLVRSGKSHVFVTGLETGLLALVALMMVGYVHAGTWIRSLLILAVLMIWIGFFLYCEFSFRQFEHHAQRHPINQ